MWREGKIQQIWNDGKIIQKKLAARPQRSSHDITRVFSKLMFEGKVGAATKFLDENAENAVLKPTPEVVEKLQSLHPEPADILPNTF